MSSVNFYISRKSFKNPTERFIKSKICLTYMEIAITKMSSKGQIVLPAEMRKGFSQGDKFLLFRDKNRIILKHQKEMDKELKEDLEFARLTEEAWQSYKRGEFISSNFDEFLNNLKKC